MDAKLNKKWLLFSIKYSSWIIGFGYFIQNVLSCFGIQFAILAFLFNVSIIPIIILILFSIFLGFCIYHRLPIYYAISANLINMYDFYIGFSISGKWILVIYLLLAGVCILIGCFIKNKQHVEERNTKETFIRNSR